MVQSKKQKICEHSLLITDLITGEISCSKCGIVQSDRAVSFGPENYGLQNDDYQGAVRTGQKISLKMADMGLSTLIESKDRDSSGKSLSIDNKRAFHRLIVTKENKNRRIDVFPS